MSDVGEVEVGGHTFDGCARWVTETTFESEDQPDFVVEAEEWTCPGFGTVRTVETNEASDTEVTEELIEFHGAAGNWYADGHEPDASRAEPVTGGAEAFDAHRTLAVPDGKIGRRLAWSDVRASPPLFPAVTDGDVVVTAERDGQVTARSRETGEPRWRVDLGSPIMATPQVAGDRLVVADRTRRIWALSLADGHALWVRRLGDVASSSPSLTDEGVLVATDDATLTLLDLADGATEWERALSQPARTPAAVEGGTAYVADMSGGVVALDTEDGTERWSRTIDDGIDQGPVLDAGTGLVLVADHNGLIHAYAASDGDERWVSATRGVSHPMSVGDGVVVASSINDRLVVLDVTTGDRLWTRRVSGTGSASVVVGDQVVATTNDGRVVVLDASDGAVADTWRLPFPTLDDTSLVDVTPALIGDDLVLSLNLPSSLGGSALFAYPVTEAADDEAAGVHLRLRSRATPPTVPNEEPVLVDDSVVMAGGADLLPRFAGGEHDARELTVRAADRGGRARRHGLRPRGRPAPGDRGGRRRGVVVGARRRRLPAVAARCRRRPGRRGRARCGAACGRPDHRSHSLDRGRTGRTCRWGVRSCSRVATFSTPGVC